MKYFFSLMMALLPILASAQFPSDSVVIEGIMSYETKMDSGVMWVLLVEDGFSLSLNGEEFTYELTDGVVTPTREDVVLKLIDECLVLVENGKVTKVIFPLGYQQARKRLVVRYVVNGSLYQR